VSYLLASTDVEVEEGEAGEYGDHQSDFQEYHAVKPTAANRRPVSAGRMIRSDTSPRLLDKPGSGGRRRKVESERKSAHMVAVISGVAIVSDTDLERISRENPGWQFERDDDGALRVSPTSTPGGAKSAEALFQLCLYAKRVGGKAFDSSTGFKTPGGGVVCPDASWIRGDRVAQFAAIDGYWAMMPDVVLEVASKTDTWENVKAKIDKYAADGAPFAVAIDPETREVYERGNPPEGLSLNYDAIVDA
jgi:Uma2 family endonuclease